MEPSWRARDAKQVLADLASTPAGLTASDAAARRRRPSGPARVAATVALPFTRLGPAFGLVPLSPTVLAAMGGIAAAYLAATEAAKRWFFATAQGGSR